MIYKDFIAEASAKIMAGAISNPAYSLENIEETKSLAKRSVAAAKMLADELEADFQNQEPDGGNIKFSEKETFFDNYVNWTKNL